MLRNKLKVLIFILMLIIVACKKQVTNSENFIRNLSDDKNFELPLVNESLMIFINKNDNIYITSLRQLYVIRQRQYSKIKDFDIFLIEVINKDLLSQKDLQEDFIPNFKLNQKVWREFKEKGLDYLKDIYCENSNTKNKYYLKTDLELNVKQSIMFIFFKNNYYIMQNDYSGNYVLIDKN